MTKNTKVSNVSNVSKVSCVRTIKGVQFEVSSLAMLRLLNEVLAWLIKYNKPSRN